MRLQALGSIYAMALLTIFMSFTLSLMVVIAEKTAKVSLMAAERVNYYPLVSVVARQNQLCITTNDTDVMSAVVDQGIYVRQIKLSREAYPIEVCVEVDPARPTVIILETRHGIYMYTPARDPLYASCAPPGNVIYPIQLPRLRELCKSTPANTVGAAATLNNYLDPIFIAYLGPALANKYRGLIPTEIAYNTHFDVNIGDSIEYIRTGRSILWDKSISDVDGIAMLLGGAGKRLYLCGFVERMPHIDDVCKTIRTPTSVEISKVNYTAAYYLHIPVFNIVIARFPGFWLLIGNGSTMSIYETGSVTRSQYYAEAVVILDNGTVKPLIWERYSWASRTIPCSPRSIEVNGWNVTLTCRFLLNAPVVANIPVVKVVDPSHSVAIYLPYNQTYVPAIGETAAMMVKALPVSYVEVKGKLYRFLPWGIVRDIIGINGTLFSERIDTASMLIYKNKYIDDDPYGPLALYALNITLIKYSK